MAEDTTKVNESGDISQPMVEDKTEDYESGEISRLIGEDAAKVFESGAIYQIMDGDTTELSELGTISRMIGGDTTGVSAMGTISGMMSGDTTETYETGAISRPALGRIANLGDLYDARTDKFCAVSILRNQKLPPDSVTVKDSPHSKISLASFSSLDEKLKEIDVSGAMKLGVLAGLVDIRGSAKYLSNKKKSFKSVESSLLYSIKTKWERLNIHSFCATSIFNDMLEPDSNSTNDDKVASLISVDAICGFGATHVVVEIYWGATITFTVTDENKEDREVKEVKGALDIELEKIKKLIAVGGGDASGEFKKHKTDVEKRFSLEICGDVLLDSSDEFPDTLEHAVEILRQIPKLISESNDGKGVPVSYVMIPLKSLRLQNSRGASNLPAFRDVDEGQIVKIVHLFDHMSELQQKARDLVDELDNHGYCVTRKELSDVRSCKQRLEEQLGRAKTELAKILGEIRSDNSAAKSCVDEFCQRNREDAEKSFEECEKVYKPQRRQIEFVKRCKKAGAKYLSPPVEERIASVCDKYGNIYVLFDGEFDPETDGETDRETLLRRNHSAFIELAKSCQNIDCLNADKTVCYFAWPEQRENVTKERVRIEHYRKGKLVDEDVIKELEAENVAQCIPAARRAFSLMPFKVACPDEDCSGDELSWTCINCKETLQFCPDDREIYCSCGRARAELFQFRCQNESHVSDFCKFNDGVLESALDHHTSLASEGKY